ncbi:MAG: type II secretion system major pseudopilin GspG [Candidatus Eisenbacteria bacterium]|jgi:general secretion pathway protein G|nr:type II secretion system major pseudopilin GspG [Candidatus Eisenbacteria bacterium]
MRSYSPRRGFTLLELLLVLVILAALTYMVVPRFSGRARKAKIAAARTDVLLNIPAALDMYELDNGAFPTTEQGLGALIEPPSTEPLPPGWDGPYVRRPIVPKDPWGKPYLYRSPSPRKGLDYELISAGPDGVELTTDDITNWE